jgi:2'-hydroxyisoflavone reductase
VFLKHSTLVTAAACATRGATLASGGAPPSGGSSLRILILGGTGFLGPALVRDATARGHLLTLFNRGKTNPHLFPDVERIRGDREQGIDGLSEAVAGGRNWDIVIDTSGYVPSHVRTVAELLAGRARQYVYLSSVGAYADHSIPADEDSPLVKADPEWVAGVRTIRESLANYGAMKGLCEVAAEEAMSGRALVVRPGLIAGPGDWSDRFTYWAVRVARGGEVLAPGDGSDPVQWVDVRDLASWILDCIERGVNGVFNAICPPDLFTFAELLHGMKGAVWTDARFTWVAPSFLEASEVQAWTHLPVWLPAVGETAAFHRVSTKRAVDAGLRFRPLAETARDTVAWLGEEKGADYDFGERAGLSREREAALLAAWHARERPPAGE